MRLNYYVFYVVMCEIGSPDWIHRSRFKVRECHWGRGGGIERWALTLSCKFIGLEVKQNVDYGSQV